MTETTAHFVCDLLIISILGAGLLGLGQAGIVLAKESNT